MEGQHFVVQHDLDELRLWQVTKAKKDAGLRWKVISPWYLTRIVKDMLEDMPVRDGPFFLAFLVVAGGEYEQRHRQRIKLDPATQYSRQTVLAWNQYARITLKRGGFVLSRLDMERLKRLLHENFIPLRKELGFPELNPARVFYTIDDEVVACAENPACQRYLEQQGTDGPLNENRFEELTGELSRLYPEDARYVLKTMKKNKTREPLSLVSMDIRRGVFLVSLVNPDGALLQVDGARFSELVRQPHTPLLLAYHTKQDTVPYKDRTVVFKNYATGRIMAKFMPEHSCISVLCLNEEIDELDGRATFMIDGDYLLCLFIVLERLREDETEYRRMKEKADVSLAGIDPFEKFSI